MVYHNLGKKVKEILLDFKLLLVYLKSLKKNIIVLMNKEVGENSVMTNILKLRSNVDVHKAFKEKVFFIFHLFRVTKIADSFNP